MQFFDKIKLFHSKIFNEKKLTDIEIKELSSLPHTYLLKSYCYSNPLLGSMLNDTCNDISVIYQLDSISLLNYLRMFFKKFKNIQYPIFTKGKGKSKKFKLPEKIQGQLGEPEAKLFMQWLINNSDEFTKNTLLNENELKELKKKTKELKKVKSNHIRKFQSNGNILSKHEIYSFTGLPKRYYDKNKYVLLDVQLYKYKEVKFIFRSLTNDKKYIVSVSANKFKYYYELDNCKVSTPILNVKNCVCKSGSLKGVNNLNNSNIYENDISLILKATADYYYNSINDSIDYNPKVFYYDIELNVEDEGSLNKMVAGKEINFLSAFYKDTYYSFCLYNKEVTIESEYKAKSGTYKLISKFYNNNESLMMQDFIKLILDLNPDIITAWNGDRFDFPYIVNRCKKLKYYKTNIHNLQCNTVYDLMTDNDKKEVIVEEKYNYITNVWTGIIITDLMQLYKNAQQNAKESWSLSFISNLELGEEYAKLKMPAADAPIEEWIRYNVRDTECMVEIDSKSQLHNFTYNMMKYAQCPWKDTYSSIGIIMGFLLSFAKENNIVLRSRISSSLFESTFLKELLGGYTQSSVGGLVDWITDYDAASMYPSLIRNFNIGPNSLRITISSEDAIRIMTNQFVESEIIEYIDRELDINIISNNEILFKRRNKIQIKDLLKLIQKNNYILTPSGGIFCSHDEEESIYYKILTRLNDIRVNVKSNMYDKLGNLIQSLYNKQWAVKISMNSFFGVFGFKSFLFFSNTLGNSITMSGRLFIKVIMQTTNTLLLENTKYWYDTDENKKKELTNQIIKLSNHPQFITDQFKTIDIKKQDDMNLRYCIYADTDGTAITYPDFFNIDDSDEKQMSDIEYMIDLTNTYIKNIVNNIYSYFNIKPDSIHKYMKFKEEWIAQKGLFYKNKRKRYALHVVKEGGKLKDEFIYRGIEIRRSDYPQIVRDKLNYLLTRILTVKKFNVSDTFDDIYTIENEFINFINERNKIIGKPISFTKELCEYKNRPQNIDAMLLWNHIYNKQIFKPASKGYLFYIDNIDETKLPKDVQDLIIQFKLSGDNYFKEFRCNSIAVPESVDILPEWIIIDKKKTLDFLWNERYTNILEPILDDHFQVNVEVDGFDFL